MTITCQFYSREPGNKHNGKCALGRYAGRPFAGQCLDCINDGMNRRGVGDVAEQIFKPIARALRLNCLDKNGYLKPQSPCSKRKELLNKIPIR